MALSRDSRRWLVAGIIAAVGWAVAIIVIVRAAPSENDPLAEYKASKGYEAGVERVGGKAAVFGAELSETVGSLFRGERLGYTIGFTSLVIACLSLVLTGPSRNEERLPSPDRRD